MFSGTLLENLDPEGLYSRDAVEKCLKLSGLEAWVDGLEVRAATIAMHVLHVHLISPTSSNAQLVHESTSTRSARTTIWFRAPCVGLSTTLCSFLGHAIWQTPLLFAA